MTGIVLWGFDGDFRGNESRMMLRPPVCLVPSTGKFFVVRSLDWSLLQERSITWLSDEADAMECATKLDITSLAIRPGQHVALLGPGMRDSIVEIAATELVSRFSGEWVALPNGFRFRLINHQEYEALQGELGRFALNVFDKEIHLGKGRDYSRKARAALAIFKASPSVPLLERATRVIAAEGILNLNKYLIAYGMTVGKSPAELKDLAVKYLNALTEKDPDKRD